MISLTKETNSALIRNVNLSDENRLKIEKFQDKIETIQKCAYKYIGVNFVTNREEKAVPVYITKNLSGNEFQVYQLDNDQMLGWARVSTYRSEEDEDYGFYPPDQKRITLEMIKNTSEEGHKQVGSLLVKAILQTFLKDCEARMELCAVRKAHPFHYKMGLRSQDPEENRLFSECLKAKEKAFDKEFKAVPMHLPSEARAFWIQEIKDHPIDLLQTSSPG